MNPWIRHPAIWIFAPTALALLYVAAHAVLAPEPTLSDLPPKEAVLVQRFRNLEAFDRMQPGAAKPPSARLGESLNIPGLPGVDRAGPVHLIQLPRKSATARSLVVLSVDDEEAVDARFHDIGLIEQGFIRHAQHLTLRDGWAAFSPDRDVTRRLGEGGLTPGDRDEDYSLAADIPRLVDHALSVPRIEPWRGLLEQLGVRVAAAYLSPDGASRAGLQGLGHLRRLQTSWARVQMWAWFARDGRPVVEVELQARPGPVGDVLGSVQLPNPGDPPPAPVPPDAEAWIQIPEARTRATLAVVAYSLGFSFGLSADAPAGSVPALVSAFSVSAGGDGAAPLTIWAQPSASGGVDVCAAGRQGRIPDPAAWLGSDVVRGGAAGFEVLGVGPSAQRAVDRYLPIARAAETTIVREPDPRERTLARIHLSAKRAQAWLGGLVAPGGLWALLAGHDLDAAVTTDGTGVWVRIRGKRAE